MRNFRVFLILSLVLLFCQIAIQAQTTGSISGSVADPNGAIIAGATVSVKNSETGADRTTMTNDKGNFTFTSLQPGIYTVTVENKGFKRSVATDVAIQVSKETQLNMTLEIGDVSTTVTVTDTQEVVNTSSPTLTNVISIKQVQDLPLSARNPLDLAGLQAGIAVTGSGTRTASIGGLRGSATNVTQDGINAMDNFVKTDSLFALSAPSLGSTSEFSITTGTTGSEAGRGVAQVNVVTRGGTNAYHGSIFYLARNSAFNANTWFNNQGGPKADGTAVNLRPDLHQHFFGFTVGGPVYFLGFGEGVKKIWDGHNKAFFFFSYEGFREKFQATRTRTVLTPEARTGIFRYTGTNGALQTVNLLGLGLLNTLNPITQKQLNAMPLPNNTLVGDGFNTSGFRYNVVGSDPSDKYVFRYDHTLVDHSRFGAHRLEFVYNKVKTSLFPDTFNGIEAPFPGGIDAGQSSKRNLLTGALVSTAGNLTNVFRYGRQWAPVSFFRNAPPTGPFIGLASPTTNFDNSFMSQGRNTIVNQYTDNVSMTHGEHLIRFGMDYQRIFADTFNDAGINPTITLGGNSSNPTGILASMFPNSTTTDVNRAIPIYADLVGLLGSASATFNVTSATSGFVQGATRARKFQEKDLALYLQDQWRMKSNLTLNGGVRWEFDGVPYETQGIAIQIDPSTLFGVSGFGNLRNPNAPAGPPPGVATLGFVNGSTGKKLFNNDLNNFAPFIGLAYSPNFKNGILKTLLGAEGKSSIRLGYAISYLHDGFTTISNALGTGVTNPGLIQTSANTTPTGVLSGAGVPLTAPVFAIPITDKQNFDLSPNNGLWAIDPNLRTPYVQQWNIGYEREIAKNTAIEVRYVGNHAVKVWRANDFNEVNIFENGFLNEFKNAQINLAARGGSNFAPGCVGCVALPILDRFFTGLSSTSTTGYGSSGFISNLTNNNVGSLASTLAFSNTYKANRQSAAIGLPANFFVANPNAAFARLLTNDSMSNYHSLQIELRRRFSQGLQFQADYTYSKSLTDAAGAAGSQSDLVNFRTLRDKRLDYFRSNQDQTQRFIANGIYELPTGKGKYFFSGVNGFLNQILGGWTIGSIVTWQGRPPFFVASGRATFTSSATNNPAQLVGITFADFKKNVGFYRRPEGVYFINPDILDIVTNPTTGRFVTSKLKPGLLGAPAPGTFGNFPLNSINGPLYFNLDMSVVKRFSVGEKVKLELKTTFINILNHPSFIYGTQNFDATNFGLITSTSSSERIIHFTGTMNF